MKHRRPKIVSQVSSFHAARQGIERMIRRNEKSLLRVALSEWKEQFADQDINPRNTSDFWYRAACHKRGKGVVDLLQEAGIEMHSWAPVYDALERGFEDLGFGMALLIPVLQPLDPHKRRDTHVLVEAARMGRLDILGILFERADSAEKKVRKAGGTIDRSVRANDLLTRLCKQPCRCVAPDMRPVVDFLVGKGGNACHWNKDGLSISERAQIIYFAAENSNTPMLLALEAAGADLRHENKSEAYMPHPLPNLQTAILNNLRDTYHIQRKIQPEQWETMELLAERGVLLDLQGEAALRRHLPTNLTQAEFARILTIAGQARTAIERRQINEGTVTVETARSRLRL